MCAVSVCVYSAARAGSARRVLESGAGRVHRRHYVARGIPCQHTFRTLFPGSRMDFRGAFLSSPSASCRHTMPRGPSSLCQQLSEVMSGLHMTTAFHRTVERRNKRVWWPILPTEIGAKRAPFRLIAPLDEKRTAYLAKQLQRAGKRLEFGILTYEGVS